MYTFDSRIRYSESNRDGFLTMEGILNLFQDCSAFQSEDLGVGIQFLNERKLVWVLSYWQIIVEEYPKFGDKIVCGTFPYEFKGCFGYRNFFLKDGKGKILAKANSLWTLLDVNTMNPAHLPKDMLERYTIEPKLKMDYKDRKVKIDIGGEEKEPIEVEYRHLDTNNHVNNGQYVKMGMALLPRNINVTQLRVEYKMQARLGDKIIPYMIKNEQGYGITLYNKEKKPYVNMEITVD